MADNLIIVESPAKAKTLKKFLGSNYKIEASVGHVKDLPKSDMGINLENDYEPKYITIRGKGEVLAKLRKEVKSAKRVYLATDPDREGEAISWHLYNTLKLSEKDSGRITFNEITKNAVKKSIKSPRKIDMSLVNAQQARRVLDRMVGYGISPLLWKKVKRHLSAGRVQSVALKIICDREEDIENFVPEEYYTITAVLSAEKAKFNANFHSIGKDKAELKTAAQVEEIISEVNSSKFIVDEVKIGERLKKPAPPFTTSTMQQEAAKALGFATSKTMLLAQQLYEGVEVKGHGAIGLLTYIRTDSVRISDEAYLELKDYIEKNIGEKYSASKRIEYKSKGRAQDAHEAIRPTYVEITPDIAKESLSRDQYRLYKLVWERFVSCQMAEAVYETVSVKISAGKYNFRSSGSSVVFDGYLKIYKPADESDEGGKLPALEKDQVLAAKEVSGVQHFTQPPARFSDASIVKTLEELGIGRPSTYSATITTILARGYVTKENKVFYPTELGEIVNDIMRNNFKEIVDIDFTAKMEDDLDKVEDGELEWKEILRRFYPGLKVQIEEAESKIGDISIEDEKSDVLCENCGANMVVKYGRFGKFLACPNFPECKNTKPFLEEAGVKCPECGLKVLVKKTKKGRRYYGCENNPQCSFMSWNKPTGEDCPACGSYLAEKGTRSKKAVCAKCGFSKPIEEQD